MPSLKLEERGLKQSEALELLRIELACFDLSAVGPFDTISSAIQNGNWRSFIGLDPEVSQAWLGSPIEECPLTHPRTWAYVLGHLLDPDAGM